MPLVRVCYLHLGDGGGEGKILANVIKRSQMASEAFPRATPMDRAKLGMRRVRLAGLSEGECSGVESAFPTPAIATVDLSKNTDLGTVA
ncbi:hypothetical protein [Phormidium sp. CCY1219]|uniref:hypothetical protein n=1 Tax=Phormidium sp. CCY1219 TaxID=2886104 RepID=UPI002D1F335D|nr:hypothetical protein [Phormidium sp. CCY1219]MEB3830460.1 hypothetical protein [Phormidium sp. CCY1219]